MPAMQPEQIAFDLPQRLGRAVMRELERAYEVCAERGPFHAEHVYRECSPETRLILDLAQNRNVLGMLFRQKAKTRRYKLSGELVPATHARSRGRLIPLWVRVT